MNSNFGADVFDDEPPVPHEPQEALKAKSAPKAQATPPTRQGRGRASAESEDDIAFTGAERAPAEPESPVPDEPKGRPRRPRRTRREEGQAQLRDDRPEPIAEPVPEPIAEEPEDELRESQEPVGLAEPAEAEEEDEPGLEEPEPSEGEPRLEDAEQAPAWPRGEADEDRASEGGEMSERRGRRRRRRRRGGQGFEPGAEREPAAQHHHARPPAPAAPLLDPGAPSRPHPRPPLPAREPGHRHQEHRRSEPERERFDPERRIQAPAPGRATSTQRVAVLLDLADLAAQTREQGGELSYPRLLRTVAGDRSVVRAIGYGPLVAGLSTHPALEIERCDDPVAAAVAATVDACALVDRVDSVVLVTSAKAFAPLARALRSRGVRVESASFRPESPLPSQQHHQLGRSCLFVP